MMGWIFVVDRAVAVRFCCCTVDDGRPVLAPHVRVLVADRPGYGATPALPMTTIETVGDAIAVELERRGVDRLHAIVGFSTGGYRAFDLALRHYPSVEVVIALASMATFDSDARAMRLQLAQAIEADRTFVESAHLVEVMQTLMLSAAWRERHPADARRVAEWARGHRGLRLPPSSARTPRRVISALSSQRCRRGSFTFAVDISIAYARHRALRHFNRG